MKSAQVVDFYMGNLEQIHREVITCECPKVICLAFPEDEFSKFLEHLFPYSKLENDHLGPSKGRRVVSNGIQSTFSTFFSSFFLLGPLPPLSASPLEKYSFLFLHFLIFIAWGYSARCPLFRAADSEVWMTKRPTLPSRCLHSWNVRQTKSNSLLQNSFVAEIFFILGCFPCLP